MTSCDLIELHPGLYQTAGLYQTGNTAALHSVPASAVSSHMLMPAHVAPRGGGGGMVVMTD